MRLCSCVLVLFAGWSVSGQFLPYYSQDAPEPRQCPCPQVWEPVCGVNGMTYPNECIMFCNGVGTQCDGPCPCAPGLYPGPFLPVPVIVPPVDLPSIDCNCPSSNEPVCAYNGETYESKCNAQCDGQRVACESKCPCT